MGKIRDKRSCFGCRALYIGLGDATCKPDYPIIRRYCNDQGFYGPDGKGNPCPKPRTISALNHELKIGRTNPFQQSLWGGGVAIR